MKKKSMFISRFTLIIVVIVLAACATKPAVEDAREIRFGVLLPLSGPLSGYGESSRNSIELYLDEVNRDGGVTGRKVVYFIEDTAWDPEIARKKAKKLIDQDRVQAILGPLGSRTSIAAGEVCGAARNSYDLYRRHPQRSYRDRRLYFSDIHHRGLSSLHNREVCHRESV